MKEFTNVVAIGASDGGVEALTAILRRLPSGLAAPVLVSLQIDPRRLSRLPSILSRAGRLPVQIATDGDRLREGHVYLAPPECTMVLSDKAIYLSDAARKRGFRPSIDPLFASAANVFEERTIGVILSGMADDGAAGLLAISRNGGITIVQDPADAPFPQMPLSARKACAADYTLPAREIGAVLALLVHDSSLLRRIA